MRKPFSIYPLVLLAAIFLPLPWCLAAEEDIAREDARGTQASESPWPVRFTVSDGEFVVYPPHFDEWRNGLLRGRAAVSVQPEGEDHPSFGTLWISARTRQETAGRMVYVDEVQVEKAEFPAASGQSDTYLAILRQRLAAKTWWVAEERLQSDMSIDRAAQRARAQPLKNDPPRIIFAQQPAVLVPIDGSPVLRDVEGTNLLRVVNTRALLLLDKASRRYYLRIAGHWMSAGSLDGPWMDSGDPSGELEQARQIAEGQGQVDLLEDEEAVTVAAAPAIYVATTPTELLQTEGPAEYSPIEGTQLLYVTNSPDNIFLDLRTQRYFVLISGRWYRAADLAGGSWEFVPGDRLPADFAMIPPDHPMAAVLAALPGTAQAKEAVIANSAPQVATIRRESARIELTYDGEPEFRPIEGTALHYAVNAPIPVIRVSADSYYALDNGVWFTARSPYGVWAVATYVPAAIYGIPVSSPLHYVTYVRIYHDTADTVDVGYTAGYVGSYVSPDYVVVFGSGWYYRPWVGYYWFGSPYTWGYGFTTFHTWWYPWGPPLYVAWRPYPCYRPWWGPWVVVRHGWIHGAVAKVHRPVAIKHPRSVTRIYDRWSPKVVARNVGFKPHPDRTAPHRPLRPGEGYIVKDGRRFDITPPDSGQHRRAWRDDDRSRLPAIQGTRPRPEQRSSAQRPDRETRGTPAAGMKAPPPSRLTTRDPHPRQVPLPQSRPPRRDDRAARPEARAVPERRTPPDVVLRQDGASRHFEALGANRETRIRATPPPVRDATPPIQRRMELSRPQELRDRDIGRPEPRAPRDSITSRTPMRIDGRELPGRRPQLSLPQREAMVEPRERREWTGQQRNLREMPRPQMQREGREFSRPQRELLRHDRPREWRGRG